MELKMKKIHADERGEIYSIPLTETMISLEKSPYGWGKDVALDISDSIKEDIAILTTHKGYARGGHSHPDRDEYFIVVKGIVKYWVDGISEIYHEGMSDVVPKDSPHFFLSLKESLIIHWGANEKKTVKHDGYRKMVEKVNKEYKP